MLFATFILSLAALSAQAPLDSAVAGELTLDTTDPSVDGTPASFNSTSPGEPTLSYDPESDFECFHRGRPLFRLNDCMFRIGDGMSLHDYTEPRWWGNIPGGLNTPRYWQPNRAGCKLRLQATQTTPKGPKPAKFSYEQIESLERMIVEHCYYGSGGQWMTAGGHARVYMKDPTYGKVRTVFDVALYSNGGLQDALPLNTTTSASGSEVENARPQESTGPAEGTVSTA